MEKLTVHVVLTFTVVPDETLTIPRVVADVIERASKAIAINDKPGVTIVRAETTSAGPGVLG